MVAVNSSTGPALFARQRADRLLQAVLDMVVDQRLLGLRNGLLDRVQLLGDEEARPLRFDHADDAAQVTFGAPQALDGLVMALVDRMAVHGTPIPSPPRSRKLRPFGWDQP